MKFSIAILVLLVITSFSYLEAQPESVCYGETKKGKIKNSVKLPLNGLNFIAYSEPAWDLGRTYVHSTVKSIWLEAMANIASLDQGYIYVYAEAGFESGGKFSPHKTHQNGLSLDIMVPVVSKKTGERIYIDTNESNLWGYEIEFDKKGETQKYSIDFESLGLLIENLHRSAVKNKVEIWRVLLDPQYHKFGSTSSRGASRLHIE